MATVCHATPPRPRNADGCVYGTVTALCGMVVTGGVGSDAPVCETCEMLLWWKTEATPAQIRDVIADFPSLREFFEGEA